MISTLNSLLLICFMFLSTSTFLVSGYIQPFTLSNPLLKPKSSSKVPRQSPHTTTLSPTKTTSITSIFSSPPRQQPPPLQRQERYYPLPNNPKKPAPHVTITSNPTEPIDSLLRRFKRATNVSGHLIALRHKNRFENRQEKIKRKCAMARMKKRVERMNRRRMATRT